MVNYLKRTWAKVSLDEIRHNFRLIKNQLDDNVKIMSVVKADAYGHGAKFVAPMLDKLGTDWFAVSNIEEALQLRELSINKPILILGYTPPFMADILSDNNISQALLNKDYANELNKEAEKLGKCVKVHIKIDTGMSRIGFVHHNVNESESLNDILSINRSNLDFEGIFTHFASSDTDGDESGEFTNKQFNLFCDIIEKLKNNNIHFRLHHCCNSAATLNNKNMHLDMVRPGIILYGLNPSSYFDNKFNLHPAMTLKSVVSMTKKVKANESVSYGRTFVADKDITVATIPVGYADGYPRLLSNNGYVIINGQKAKIIGRVCMDQMLVDISGIDNVTSGTEVLLFGNDGENLLPIDDFARLCNTINYEIVCLIGKRVTRVFIEDGKETSTLNYVYNL